MSIWDYHRRWLDPYVWGADERTLTSRTQSQLDEQVRTRFPTAEGVYLVGALVGHYWDPESELDVLVRVPDDNLPGYRDDARIASGRKLLPSEHRVNFWLVSAQRPPDVIARHFGPIYDIFGQQWFGERNTSESELLQPGALLRQINWQLYKAKRTLDPYPEKWTVATEAFNAMRPEHQLKLIEALQMKVGALDNNVQKGLRDADASVWKALEEFEHELYETGNDDLPTQVVEAGTLPDRQVKAVLHKFRYDDLLETLQQQYEQSQRLLAEKQEQEMRMAATNNPKTIQHKGVTYRKIGSAAAHLWARFESSMHQLLMAEGGYEHAVDVVFDAIVLILDKSRYINTTSRRKEIVYRLYRRYYQGKGE